MHFMQVSRGGCMNFFGHLKGCMDPKRLGTTALDIITNEDDFWYFTLYHNFS